MPALVKTAPLPDYPDCTAYQITGRTHGEVQDAMLEIMDAAPEAHFRMIRRCDAGWGTQGYVRATRLHPQFQDTLDETVRTTRALAAAE